MDSTQSPESFRSLLLRHRGQTGLIQRDLAARAGVSQRSVQDWEGGVTVPSAEQLQALLRALLEAGGLTVGWERSEARVLWAAVEREAPRMHTPLDERWFTGLLATHTSAVAVRRDGLHAISASGTAVRALVWSEEADSTDFVGRAPELALLKAERARMARDLHDTVSQTLYAIILGASRARSLLHQKESREIQRIIEDILQLANAGQSELRALLSDMRANHVTGGGLTAALESLAEEARTRSSLGGMAGLDIRLAVGEELDLPAPTTEALLMIVREALNNIVRHSDAARVDIVLQQDLEQLTLLISDDGCGFDSTTPRPGHFGLQSIRERAKCLGATLTLSSNIGFGTQVRVSIPRHVHAYG